MGHTIKIRPVVRDIKTLDRAGMVADKLKNSTLRTKEEAEKIQSTDNSPTQFSADKIQRAAEYGATKTARLAGSLGKGIVRRILRRPHREPTVILPEPPVEPIIPDVLALPESSTIPMKAPQSDRLVKQGVGRIRMNTRRPSIKQAERTLKTMERGGGQTVQRTQRSLRAVNRTVRHTSQSAQGSARTARQAATKSAKAAKKAAQTARNTAKATAKTTKAAWKATVTTVKAIIASAKSLVAALAAGGSVVVAIVLIVCLVGLLIASAFAIFLGNDVEQSDGLTVRQAVAEINGEYYERIDTIIDATPNLNDTQITLNGSNRSGLRDVWKDVLVVYSAKQHSEALVIAFDDAKLEELRGVFWNMVAITHRTEDVNVDKEVVNPDTGEIVVETEVKKNLYINVTSKKSTDMIALYHLNTEQQDILKELMDPSFDSEWQRLLFGASGGNLDIVEVAASQIGNIGGRPYWTWYGFSSRMEWCAVFVSWCANECGFLDSGIIPKFSSCTSQGRAWFQAHGQWQEPGYVPSPGEIIFFDWDLSGNCDHVGIVESVENGVIHTIEGNSGDRVRRKSYSVDYACIAGFGTPGYN